MVQVTLGHRWYVVVRKWEFSLVQRRKHACMREEESGYTYRLLYPEGTCVITMEWRKQGSKETERERESKPSENYTYKLQLIICWSVPADKHS